MYGMGNFKITDNKIILHNSPSLFSLPSFLCDQKYSESFEMRRCRRIEVSWAYRVTNEVLQRVKEKRNILHTIK